MKRQTVELIRQIKNGVRGYSYVWFPDLKNAPSYMRETQKGWIPRGMLSEYYPKKYYKRKFLKKPTFEFPIPTTKIGKYQYKKWR